jgi:hypothetical protein
MTSKLSLYPTNVSVIDGRSLIPVSRKGKGQLLNGKKEIRHGNGLGTEAGQL